jgi:hypothetical protein
MGEERAFWSYQCPNACFSACINVTYHTGGDVPAGIRACTALLNLPSLRAIINKNNPTWTVITEERERSREATASSHAPRIYRQTKQQYSESTATAV